MSQTLKISIVQSKIIWQDVQQNLDWFEGKLESIVGATDLIVLPEMFTTGFSMENSKLAEAPGGKAMQWMHRMAEKYNAVVVGSIMMNDQGKFFNRLVWMHPSGEAEFYDKRHLFRMANEHNHYTEGTSRLVFIYKGWKICPLICYDLRFPVWSRNRFINNQFDYDCLLYVANWPEKRSHAWKSLLVARAIENQSYVIGVNRIGNDGNGITYSGDSVVLDFKGEKVSKTERYGERVETVIITKNELDDYRVQFPAGLDADNFTVHL